MSEGHMGLLPTHTAFLLVLRGMEDGGKILFEVTAKLLMLVCKS